MRLELAPSVLKISSDYARGRFPSLGRFRFNYKSLADDVYDLSVIPAVYQYHLDEETVRFDKYYRKFLPKFFRNANTDRLLKNAFKLYQKKARYWHGLLSTKDTWGFVGDLHLPVTKMKYKNSVYYENVLNYEACINDLSKIIPSYSRMFPVVNLNNDYVKRRYIRPRNDRVDGDVYYFNFGKILAFGLFFKVIDLNFENFLIRDEYTPYVFDLEFLLTPIDNFEIAYTGLISSKTTDNYSSLLGGYYDVYSYLKPVVLIDEKGELKIKWKVHSKRKLINIPKKFTHHPYKYIDNVISGYNSACNELLAAKDAIYRLFSDNRFSIRFLFRPTSVYRYTLLEYIYPHISSSFEFDSFVKKSLNKTSIIKSMDMTLKKTLLLQSEINDLKSLSIPFFRVDAHDRHILDSRGRVVASLKDSPLNMWKNHIDNFKDSYIRERAKIKKIIQTNYERSQANAQ